MIQAQENKRDSASPAALGGPIPGGACSQGFTGNRHRPTEQNSRAYKNKTCMRGRPSKKMPGPRRRISSLKNYKTKPICVQGQQNKRGTALKTTSAAHTGQGASGKRTKQAFTTFGRTRWRSDRGKRGCPKLKRQLQRQVMAVEKCRTNPRPNPGPAFASTPALRVRKQRYSQPTLTRPGESRARGTRGRNSGTAPGLLVATAEFESHAQVMVVMRRHDMSRQVFANSPHPLLHLCVRGQSVALRFVTGHHILAAHEPVFGDLGFE